MPKAKPNQVGDGLIKKHRIHFAITPLNPDLRNMLIEAEKGTRTLHCDQSKYTSEVIPAI